MFTVGAVIRQTVQTFFKNIIPFTILSILGVLVIWAVFYFVFSGYSEILSELKDERALFEYIAAHQSELLVRIVLSAIIATAIVLALNASIVYGTIVDLRGSSAGLGECATKGLAKVPGALGISLLLIIAIVAVMLLLITVSTFLGGGSQDAQSTIVFLTIPFVIYLAIRWYVAIPALVVENSGVVGALKRSADLTSGYRLQILVLISFSAAVSWALSKLSFILMGVLSSLGAHYLGMFAELVLQAISIGFGAVLIAVVYHDLRVSKEGLGTDQIASTLD